MDREQMIEVMWSVLSPDGATQTDLIDRGNLSAAIAALEAAGVVMVPREPTEAMVDAGVRAETGGTWGTKVANIYTAMLAARPK